MKPRNKNMKLFSLKTANYAWNNDEFEPLYSEETYFCRVCGKKMEPDTEIKLIPANLTDNPGLAKKTNGKFHIHAHKCIPLKNSDMIKHGKTTYRGYANRLKDGNIINLNSVLIPVDKIEPENADNFQKALQGLEQKRQEAMKTFQTKAKLNDDEISILNRLRIIGTHINLANNKWQNIK